ncbi:hypothetical protein [Nocardia stercoris]|uniref:Uncharacterized protein n=1 Tax=Nocardia stercoris TaxID=2483361 RepID=A0A3M2KZM6_9NOCA|nr:hypothetical protein [Nocardia stercoris]RMI29713.1 hypothetical protein EBN03_25315 [Nocardia stercoris]
MTIVVGRSPARIPVVAQARRTAAARLRGGAAGVVCGVLAIAAHGWAAGGPPPASGALTLLLAAATVVGAVVTTLPSARRSATALAAALLAGQALSHAALSADAMTMPGGHAMWTPAMLAAHTVAAAVAATVIHGAGLAHRTLATAWARIRLHRLSYPVTQRLPLRSIYRPRVVRQILATCGPPTRGPPILLRG